MSRTQSYPFVPGTTYPVVVPVPPYRERYDSRVRVRAVDGEVVPGGEQR
jgi:hypothetical protein